MFISYEETCQELGLEPIEESIRIDNTSRDVAKRKNFMMQRPKGILVQDSYNNFAFPIRPFPRFDTNKFDLKDLSRRYKELYIFSKSDSLPWHFMVEMVGNKYYCFNTRPFMMKYPLGHDELIKREKELPFDVKWNEETKDFMQKRRFLVNEAIHICILGDTHMDVYPKHFYRVLGSFAIRPFIHYFRLPQTSRTRTFALNTGSKFNQDYVFKYLYS